MMTIQETSTGIRFGVLGGKPATPAPTIIAIDDGIADALQHHVYAEAARILGEHGWISVALDTPCHGDEHKPGEPDGLYGWRARLESGENFVGVFTQKISEVVDQLVSDRCSDPKKLAVAGTSRAGFLALHFMAADPRVKCAVALAPVVELPTLAEFKGLEQHPLTKAIALPSVAEKLAGRPIWICIGNNDQRVGTDNVITFTRKVVAASLTQGKPAPIEIHVMPADGHSIHKTAHEEAAAWLRAQVNP